MKFYFLVLVSLFIISCENVEKNSPAMQGKLNNTLFQAIEARATLQEDSTLIIQGITAIEVLTLKVGRFSTGTYNLGTQANNYGSFDKQNTFFYNTNPDGDGQIVVSDIDYEGQTVSGTFRFNAIAPGIDTLNFQEGVFYQIPYSGGTTVDPENNRAGTVTARLNGNIFNSFFVTAFAFNQFITITGTNAGKSIILTIPVAAVPGLNEINTNGYAADYKVGLVTEDGTSGNIIVFSNDPVERRIKGTFSFETATNSIREGNFNVVY